MQPQVAEDEFGWYWCEEWNCWVSSCQTYWNNAVSNTWDVIPGLLQEGHAEIDATLQLTAVKPRGFHSPKPT